MRNRRSTLLPGLILVLTMSLAWTRTASAHSISDQLPQFKNPSTAKFSLSGTTGIGSTGLEGNTATPISGTGTVSGKDYDLNITTKSSGGNGIPALEITSSQRMVDEKVYSKVSIDPGSEGQWYVTDSTGVLRDNPSGGIGSILGINADKQQFYKSTLVGNEEIDGVATTKYRLDIDFKGLAADAGTNVDILGDVQYVQYLWIGDNDQYIYKDSYMLDAKSGTGTSQIDLTIQYDVSFYDFDVPVTIAAPTDAVPINAGSIPGVTGGMPTAIDDSGMGMPGMTSAGMPATGSGSGTSTLPIALLALSIGLVVSGVAVRRKATVRA